MSECLDENSALELLDGTLASSARARFERHIDSCDACRELVAELARVDAEESGGAVDTERTAIADSSSGLTHAGPYRIEREIGSGSAGTVYRAIDERTRQVVALKYVTDPSWRARFGREVETLSRLVHPGIVRYVGHGETPHGLYLAMEWLDGEDLEQALRRGPLSWQAARVLGLRITAALAHAHAIGAVHRDLTPRNIFLPAGRVDNAKLLDFGLVRVHDGLERTASQAVLGTPFYMAPEQVKDPKSVDARADLFALGVVLYEAISGVRPFHADDLFTVWVKIVDHHPPDLRTITRGVPEPFIRLVEALLAKDPAARPASAADVHRHLLALEALASSVVAPAPPPFVAPPSGAARPPGPAGFGSHSGGPHVFVESPHAPVAPPRPPSRRGSGVFVVAGVGVTAIVAASTIAVIGPKLARRAIPAPPSDASEVDASADSSPAPAPPTPKGPLSAATAEDPAPRITPSPTAAKDKRPKNETDAGARDAGASPKPSPSVERLFCGAENVERRSGGNYQSDPANPELEAVTIAGRCKATLEDCTIGGPRSVQVIGESELTLRRCRVLGDVKLIGTVTLTLEATTLPKPPTIVGKGRVIRR